MCHDQANLDITRVYRLHFQSFFIRSFSTFCDDEFITRFNFLISIRESRSWRSQDCELFELYETSYIFNCDQFIKFNLWSNLLTNYSLNEHYSSIIPKLDIIPSLENLPISVKSSNYKINFYSIMLKKKEKTYLFYCLNGINFYYSSR